MKARWMKAVDVLKLLNNIKRYIKKMQKYFPQDIIKKEPHPFFQSSPPQSGEFFIVDTRTCSEWKMDNNCYFKKPGTDRI